VPYTKEIWKQLPTYSSSALSPVWYIWSQVAAWSDCQNLGPPQRTDGSDCEGWFMAVTREGTKAAHTPKTFSPCGASRNNVMQWSSENQDARLIQYPWKSRVFVLFGPCMAESFLLPLLGRNLSLNN
jgi:hypothetical protein